MTLFWTDCGLFAPGHGHPFLVLMTDRRLANPLAAAAKLPQGSWVILRCPEAPMVPEYAVALRRLCRRRRLRFHVSGNHLLAERLQADGLHLPEALAKGGCLARHLAWVRAYRCRLLSVAAHSRQGLARAAWLQADAAILSPVFATNSHPQAKPLGAVRFCLMAKQSKVPVIALGGIDRRSCKKLAHARIQGIGGISAFI